MVHFKAGVRVAIILIGAYQLEAETVEQYQSGKSKSGLEAALDEIYYQGLREGAMLANAQLLMESIINGSPNMLFCQPSHLALTNENYRSIIDDEIKRRLTAAAGNPTETRKVMQTDLRILLLPALKRTFPCSTALIQQAVEEIREQLQSANHK